MAVAPSGRPLRVIRLVSELDFGGVETGIAIQAELIDREKFDFRICTFWKAGATAERVRSLGIPVDVLGTSPSVYRPLASLALARYLRKVKPDVLHASVTEADFHAAILAPLRLAKRTIIDEAGFPEIARPRRRLMFKVLNRLVDDIIVVSSGLGAFLARYEGASWEKFRLIPNCGQPEYFITPKVSYEQSSARFRLAAVGRLVDVKNHETIIRAVAQHADRKVELHIFGSGPLHDQLSSLVHAEGVADRVKLRGYVEGSLRDELAAMDGYLMPSHAEGCSLALIEAMALGLPLAASRVSGNMEVVGSIGEDWLVDPTDVVGWADAIAQMQSLSPEQRKARGLAARRRAQENYSPEIFTRTLERLYLGEPVRRPDVPPHLLDSSSSGPLPARPMTPGKRK
jgi:glycosyltransferase involved in cell wall biosynthesis